MVRLDRSIELLAQRLGLVVKLGCVEMLVVVFVDFIRVLAAVDISVAIAIVSPSHHT